MKTIRLYKKIGMTREIELTKSICNQNKTIAQNKTIVQSKGNQSKTTANSKVTGLHDIGITILIITSLYLLSTAKVFADSVFYDTYDGDTYDSYVVDSGPTEVISNSDNYSDTYFDDNASNLYAYNSSKYRSRDDDDDYYTERKYSRSGKKKNRGGGMPSTISGYGEKVIIINPRIHRWGAYSASGELLRSGMATAGSSWCRDIKRACRTRSGSFRINSLGSRSCKSTRYPLGRGGAPMPYCMFFNGNQGLHGSYEVVNGNVSHGCVRVHVGDAEWIRFNFARIGTRVIVLSY